MCRRLGGSSFVDSRRLLHLWRRTHNVRCVPPVPDTIWGFGDSPARWSLAESHACGLLAHDPNNGPEAARRKERCVGSLTHTSVHPYIPTSVSTSPFDLDLSSLVPPTRSVFRYR
jgi:hypothetical protein